MARIIGQKAPLTTLSGIYNARRMHHAYFFHGEEGIGKFESALNFTKAIYCIRQNGAYCDTCPECIKINEYRHPDVLVAATDPRHGIAKFFYTRALETEAEPFFRAFKSQARNILSRTENGLLPAYETYPSKSPEAYMLGAKSERNRAAALEIPYRAANRTLERMNARNLSLIDDVYREEKMKAIEVAKSRGTYRAGKKNEGRTATFFEALETVYHNITHTTLPIDTVRDIIGRIERKPQSALGRTVLIEGIDLMEASCANIFLRTLEEPPEGNRFLLITSNYEKMRNDVLNPLRSRTMLLGFNALSAKTLKKVFLESFKLSEKRADELTALGRGSVGRALMRVYRDDTTEGTLRERLLLLFGALKKKNAFETVTLMRALSENDDEAESTLEILNAFLADIVKKKEGNADIIMEKEAEDVFIDISPRSLILFVEETDALLRQSYGQKTKKKLLVLRVLANLKLLIEHELPL